MALLTDVPNRYATQNLVELTNPQDRNAIAISTRLDRAVDDVEGMFPIYAGVAFDENDANHVAIGSEGVVALLIRRTGQAIGEARMAQFLSALRALGQIEGRNRVTPDSTTKMQPSEDDRLSTTPRPAFDDRHFDAFLPNPAPGGFSIDSGFR